MTWPKFYSGGIDNCLSHILLICLSDRAFYSLKADSSCEENCLERNKTIQSLQTDSIE